MRPEVQTTIDECADGSWEGVLYAGSNFITRLHASSFLACAVELEIEIRTLDRTPEDSENRD